MPKVDPTRLRLLGARWKLLAGSTPKTRHWISPYDNKTYLEEFALIVQDTKDVEQRESELYRPADWQPNDVDISEEEFDRRFPPVKKKVRSKNAKQRRKPVERS